MYYMPDELHQIFSHIKAKTIFENVIPCKYLVVLVVAADDDSGDKDGNDDQNVSASNVDR